MRLNILNHRKEDNLDRAIISKKLGQILNDIEKLKSTVAAIDGTDISKYPENYSMLTTDAALRSELITCRMRHLIYQSTDIKKEYYLTSAGIVQGIRINEKDGVLNIVLPCLLPKKKKRNNTEYLLDPLYFTLSQYLDSHSMPRYKHCVVCFSHVYSKDFPKRNIRDYDNLELKQLLDVIATFIMEDDTGLLVDAYNTTEIGEADCTQISVMDKDMFTRWLNEREKQLKTISDFR